MLAKLGVLVAKCAIGQALSNGITVFFLVIGLAKLKLSKPELDANLQADNLAKSSKKAGKKMVQNKCNLKKVSLF